MKSLVVYIQEAIRKLPKSVSGIIVFDIDDTLLKVNGDMIRVYKRNLQDAVDKILKATEIGDDGEYKIEGVFNMNIKQVQWIFDN